jgi:hypothetical protein
MTDDELVAAYLRRLRRAARALPRARRQELADEIAEHIADARASGAQSGEGGSAALRNALERLGEPPDIIAAAGGPARGGRPGGLEIAAVALLLAGGMLGVHCRDCGGHRWLGYRGGAVVGLAPVGMA